jgi:hypothetical protein
MIVAGLRKWLAFGSGVGIALEGARGEESLQAVAVRVRPSGAKVLDTLTIENFRAEPAAEWGRRYAEFIAKLGMQHVAATVLLPRQDVILRQLSLPGVADADLGPAVQFQLDGLHPYDEADVTAGWARLEGSDTVAVAIARRELLDSYTTLFSEAGVKLAGFTCMGIAVFSALRVFGARAGDVLAVEPLDGALEVYGESAAKPLFSAAFDGDEERAIALAASELRLEAATPQALAELLGGEPSRAFAAAMSSACPLLSSPLNLLSAELRQGQTMWQWVPTAALGTAVALTAVALWLLPGYRNGTVLEALEQEIARVQPLAVKASAADQQIASARARTLLLDNLRRKSKLNMDVLSAMTNLLQAPAWVQSMTLDDTQVSVTGETNRAEPLLRIIDDSPIFESSEFTSPPARITDGEHFSIRTKRATVGQK